jgi:hypothetical protein
VRLAGAARTLAADDHGGATVTRRRARALCVAGAAAATIAASAGPARAVAPIEGSWLFDSGEVLVQATGPGTFTGTVVKPTTFAAACPHPAGQQMWQISGSGLSYTGTHVWYGADCSEKPGGKSTWTITSSDPASFTLRFCTVNVGGGPPTFDVAGNPVGGTICNDLKRLLPPAPKPTFNAVVSLPKETRKCRSRRDFRIRLREPKADPLVRATVQVNGRQVRVLAGTRLTAPVNLRGLPTGRYAVKIVATTASGRVIQGTRRYRTCARKRR